MQDIIRGKAYVVGDNVDTDQIIPARHLTLNPAIPQEREQFGRHALAGVPDAQAGLPRGGTPFVDQTDESNTRSDYAILIAGKNFGCGSSREHAPLALAEAGVKAVVAEFYARIFFRNAINGGYLIPLETSEQLIGKIRTGDEIEIYVNQHRLINRDSRSSWELRPLGDVAPIIEAGGVFEYARQTGML